MSTFNPSTWEAVAGGSSAWPVLHNEFQESQGSLVKPHIQIKKKKKKKKVD